MPLYACPPEVLPCSYFASLYLYPKNYTLLFFDFITKIYPMAFFSQEEKIRYARQTILPMIKEAGQMRLKSARVLIIGAGGLGSSPAIYLTAAGVGTLGLVDAD